MNKKLMLLFVVIFIIFLDLSSKSIVKNIFHTNETAGQDQSIEITSFLNMKNLCNHGVSFGIMQDMSHKTMQIFISFIFALLLIYSYFLIKAQNINLYGNLMIIGGALANLIDRFQNQCVYDFIDFHIGIYHFYVFNIADSAITIGAIIILLPSFRKEKTSN